jgi:hypothetical protein
VEVVLDVGGGRGKGLVATAPLAPGDLVLEERPLVSSQTGLGLCCLNLGRYRLGVQAVCKGVWLQGLAPCS